MPAPAPLDSNALDAARAAGRVVAEILERTAAACVPGATGASLDTLAREICLRRGAVPSFLGFPSSAGAFPAALCISRDAVAVYGVPDDAPFANGELVSIDVGAQVRGWHADAAVTVACGEVDDVRANLLRAVEAALAAGVAACAAGRRVGDISAAIEAAARCHAVVPLRGYGGHGVGRELHTDPPIPNTGRAGRGRRIRPGWCLAVEPILSAGSAESVVVPGTWGVQSADGMPVAQAEHTVVVGFDGPEVLTGP